MFPRCSITVQIDADTPVKVGFDLPRAALEKYLSSRGPSHDAAGERYRVEERTLDGVTLAYALRYSSFFKDWAFVGLPGDDEDGAGNVPVAAICVEGIMVESRSPGFSEGGLLAIANATGKGSPKTNVARSSLEETEEKSVAIQKVYDMYVAQLDDECQRLTNEEGYPLSCVINQIPYIVNHLKWEEDTVGGRYRGDFEASHPLLLRRAFAKLPVFLVETQPSASQRHWKRLGSWEAFGPLRPRSSLQSSILLERCP